MKYGKKTVISIQLLEDVAKQVNREFNSGISFRRIYDLGRLQEL